MKSFFITRRPKPCCSGLKWGQLRMRSAERLAIRTRPRFLTPRCPVHSSLLQNPLRREGTGISGAFFIYGHQQNDGFGTQGHRAKSARPYSVPSCLCRMNGRPLGSDCRTRSARGVRYRKLTRNARPKKGVSQQGKPCEPNPRPMHLVPHVQSDQQCRQRLDNPRVLQLAAI
jgi:hypothetical protein